MTNPQNSGHEPFKEMQQHFNMAIGISQAFAMPARAWLTKLGTAGEMYFGNRLTVTGWVILLIWPMLSPVHDPEPMHLILGLTTLLLLAHRARHWSKRRNGYRPHSEFWGNSQLEFLGGVALAKRLWEPLLTALCGVACVQWNEPFGVYLIWSAIAMAISAWYVFVMDANMSRRVNDARREQEWLAEKMQEEDGN